MMKKRGMVGAGLVLVLLEELARVGFLGWTTSEHFLVLKSFLGRIFG